MPVFRSESEITTLLLQNGVRNPVVQNGQPDTVRVNLGPIKNRVKEDMLMDTVWFSAVGFEFDPLEDTHHSRFGLTKTDIRYYGFDGDNFYIYNKNGGASPNQRLMQAKSEDVWAVFSLQSA